MELEQLRFPVGKFVPPAQFDDAFRAECIAIIQAFPEKLKEKTAGFTEREWLTPYREGGWNGVQVVHHLADSHLNAFCRFKLGLTENNPLIKSYEEKDWAMTADANILPPSASIILLEGLHQRWTVLLGSLKVADFSRTVARSESDKLQSLNILLGVYAWHCRHHLGHLEIIKSSVGEK